MKVVIKEREHEYETDFPAGWKFSAGDEFKFPVYIADYPCFVKRFRNKKPANITGWDLMNSLKGKNVPGFPRLHDIVNTRENDRNIYYVFYEYLEGKTLNVLLAARKEIDLQRLSDGIFNALSTLNAHGYWFVDFCEKNVFCTDTKFFLVDIDSTTPVSDMPDNGMDGNKDYWILVFNFYKEILNKDVRPADINGINFNYLQLVFLLLRVKLFQKEDYREYDAHELFNKLPRYLNKLSPAYKDFFHKALENNTSAFRAADISELKSLVRETIVNDVDVEADASEELIQSFTTNAKKNEDGNYVVNQKESFMLNWAIRNAETAQLLRNGESYKELENGDGSEKFTEQAFDGKSKTVKYTLRATSGVIANEENITINVAAEPAVVKALPVIKKFVSDKANVYSRQEFVLSWDVLNADDVELLKNGNLFKKLFESEGSINLLEEVFDGKQKRTVYELQAYNRAGKTTSDPVALVITSPKAPPVDNSWTKKILIGASVAVLAFLIFLFYPSNKKPVVNMFTQSSVKEGDTVTITGQNLPDGKGELQVDFDYAIAKILEQYKDKLVVLVPRLANPNKAINVKVYANEKLLAKKDGVMYYERKMDTVVATTPVLAIDTTKAATTFDEDKIIAQSKAATKAARDKLAGNRKRLALRNMDTVKTVVNTTPVEEPKKVVVNVRDFVGVSLNDFKKRLLGGVAKVEVTVRNNSTFTLQTVTVQIDYLKGDSKVVKSETLNFTDVKPNSFAKREAPNSGKGSGATVKLISVFTKEFGKQ